MKKGLLLLLIVCPLLLISQTGNFGKLSYYRNNPIMKKPALGVGFGGTYFFGDIGSAEIGVVKPALSFKFDYRLSRSFGVEINSAGGFFGQKYEPGYHQYDFEATFSHWAVGVRYHFDNLFNLSPFTVFSPYVTTGVGYMIFKSYRNLHDSQGNPYIFEDDGTITDGLGNIVERNSHYETPIDPDGEYPHNTIIHPVGGGIKFNFSEHFEMNVEAMVILTHHDYIEGYLGYTEVADGTWERNEPNKNNDAYFYGGITFMYNFGYNPMRRTQRHVPRVSPNW